MLDQQKLQIEKLARHIRKAFGVKQEKAIAIIFKMMHSQMKSAFQAWLEHTELLKKHDLLFVGIASRFRMNAAAKALGTWQEYRLRHKWIRKFVTRMLGGRTLRLFSEAFTKWKSHMVVHKDGKVEAEFYRLCDELETQKEAISERLNM